MSDEITQPDFAPYAVKYAPEVQEVRRGLDPKTLQALLDVLDELAQEPLRYPHRTRPISRDKKTLLYTHPQPALEITFEVDGEHHIVYFMHFAAPVMQATKPLFVSYSHHDVNWLNELRKWLEPLERMQLVKIWADTEIRAGSEWQKEIEKSLDAAKAALLLVSDHFIASEFIATQELPRLLQAANGKGVIILWLAVSKVTSMSGDIGKYEALNDPGAPLDSLEPLPLHQAWGRIFERTKAALQF